MKVRVSKKLRGELSIDAIGYPVKAGQVIELSPEQEAAPNILTSILRGLLVDVDAVKEVVVKEDVKVEETTKKMTLTELNKVHQKDDSEEEDKVCQEEKEAKKIQDEVDASATSTEMSAFDMEKKTLLGKEDSTKAALDRSGGVEIESLQVGENIDFSDESESTPDIDPLAKPETKVDIFEDEIEKKPPKKKAKKAKKSTKKKSKKAKKKTTTKNVQKKLKEAADKISESAIKPVGKHREEKTTDMLTEDNIGFVDREQEKELLAKRPELNNEDDTL